MKPYDPQNTAQLYNKYSQYGYLANYTLPVFTGFKKENNSVLITGAGGFLSLHLIEKMQMDNRFSSIVCLVRNKEKFLASLKKYGVNVDVARLQFIEKDLNSLSASNLKDLNIDLVIHTAAKINCMQKLNFFEHDNIKSSINLYEICNSLQLPLMICSTLSVFASSNKVGQHKPEKLTPDSEHKLWGGYAQSKIVCELLAPKNTMIARYGLLCADTQRHIFPDNDFFVEFVQALHTLQKAPQNAYNSSVDITPVNVAARQTLAILEAMSINKPNYSYASTFTASPEQRQSLKDKVFHIASPKPLSSLAFINFMNLKSVPDNKFWLLTNNKLKSAAQPPISSIQQYLLSWAYDRPLAQKVFPDVLKNIDLFQSTNQDWCPFFRDRIFDYELIKSYIKAITSPKDISLKLKNANDVSAVLPIDSSVPAIDLGSASAIKKLKM